MLKRLKLRHIDDVLCSSLSIRDQTTRTVQLSSAFHSETYFQDANDFGINPGREGTMWWTKPMFNILMISCTVCLVCMTGFTADAADEVPGIESDILNTSFGGETQDSQLDGDFGGVEYGKIENPVSTVGLLFLCPTSCSGSTTAMSAEINERIFFPWTVCRYVLATTVILVILHSVGLVRIVGWASAAQDPSARPPVNPRPSDTDFPGGTSTIAKALDFAFGFIFVLQRFANLSSFVASDVFFVLTDTVYLFKVLPILTTVTVRTPSVAWIVVTGARALLAILAAYAKRTGAEIAAPCLRVLLDIAVKVLVQLDRPLHAVARCVSRTVWTLTILVAGFVEISIKVVITLVYLPWRTGMAVKLRQAASGVESARSQIELYEKEIHWLRNDSKSHENLPRQHEAKNWRLEDEVFCIRNEASSLRRRLAEADKCKAKRAFLVSTVRQQAVELERLDYGTRCLGDELRSTKARLEDVRHERDVNSNELDFVCAAAPKKRKVTFADAPRP